MPATRGPGRPTDERRLPYNVSLRPSVVREVERVGRREKLSRSQAVERLILEALEARARAT